MTSRGKDAKFIDNCTAHHVEGLELSNSELQFLPANCTSLIQPFDKGIINSVKCSYRWRLIQKLLVNILLQQDTKVDIVQAVEMLEASRRETSAEIVANCFCKAHISMEVQAEEIDAREQEPSCPPDLAKAWIPLRTNGGALTMCRFVIFYCGQLQCHN